MSPAAPWRRVEKRVPASIPRARRKSTRAPRDRPLRHPSNAAHTVDELIEALKDLN